MRGPRGEGALTVFDQLPIADRAAFDCLSRERAISLASSLDLRGQLNLNVAPGDLDASDVSIRRMLIVAARCGLAANRLVVELTEGEAIQDLGRFGSAVNDCRGQGLRVALDDFGAGYSGLNLLADFQPDLLKLDMNLVRNIESRGPRQAIVRAIMRACEDLAIDVIAEGIETRDEYHWFKDEGVVLFQGYLFAHPGFECLPAVHDPDRNASDAASTAA